jgi:hypothetical protein
MKNVFSRLSYDQNPRSKSPDWNAQWEALSPVAVR